MTPARNAAVRRDDEDVTPTAVYDRPRLTVVESPKAGPIRRAVRTVSGFFAVGPMPT
jgi:hypothetical protein